MQIPCTSTVNQKWQVRGYLERRRPLNLFFIKLIGFISDGAPHAGQVIRGSQDGAWHQGMILLIVDTNGEKR